MAPRCCGCRPAPAPLTSSHRDQGRPKGTHQSVSYRTDRHDGWSDAESAAMATELYSTDDRPLFSGSMVERLTKRHPSPSSLSKDGEIREDFSDITTMARGEPSEAAGTATGECCAPATRNSSVAGSTRDERICRAKLQRNGAVMPAGRSGLVGRRPAAHPPRTPGRGAGAHPAHRWKFAGNVVRAMNRFSSALNPQIDLTGGENARQVERRGGGPGPRPPRRR